MEENEDVFGARRRSKVEMYAHIVWATKAHCAVLTPKLERAAHRCIIAEAEKMHCDILAIGGMPDHIHLLVRLPGDLGPSAVAKQVKGASSYLLNTLREPHSDRFNWQKGFAAFSLHETILDRAISYIQNQREHHKTNQLWERWEETDEPDPTQPPTLPPSEGR